MTQKEYTVKFTLFGSQAQGSITVKGKKELMRVAAWLAAQALVVPVR